MKSNPDGGNKVGFLAPAPLSVKKLRLPAGPALRERRLPGRRRSAASRAAKMAARWSSENVVVEFRDSQVAGAVFGAARWPFPGLPACSVPSRPSALGVGGIPAAPPPWEMRGLRRGWEGRLRIVARRAAARRPLARRSLQHPSGALDYSSHHPPQWEGRSNCCDCLFLD